MLPRGTWPGVTFSARHHPPPSFASCSACLHNSAAVKTAQRRLPCVLGSFTHVVQARGFPSECDTISLARATSLRGVGRMAPSQDVPQGDEAVLPVDVEALKKYTREQDWRDLQSTCELV